MWEGVHSSSVVATEVRDGITLVCNTIVTKLPKFKVYLTVASQFLALVAHCNHSRDYSTGMGGVSRAVHHRDSCVTPMSNQD